jgi:membrane protein implicated in regulation of membrane protease activity
MTSHITTAKVLVIFVKSLIAAAVGAVVSVPIAQEFNWNILITAIVAAGVSSTISAIASVLVAVYLRRPMDEMNRKQDDTHIMLNSQKTALEELQRKDAKRANKAEGELKGISENRKDKEK